MLYIQNSNFEFGLIERHSAFVSRNWFHSNIFRWSPRTRANMLSGIIWLCLRMTVAGSHCFRNRKLLLAMMTLMMTLTMMTKTGAKSNSHYAIRQTMGGRFCIYLCIQSSVYRLRMYGLYAMAGGGVGLAHI